MGKKLFSYVIGNPPYQEESELNNRQSPIYHKFMDAAYDVADVAELVTPARFLFDAGQTPKAWNKKMLSDPHFKVLMYERDCTKVFPTTDIKGGVAITIRNSLRDYGSIDVFTDNPQLNDIKQKVAASMKSSLADCAYPKSYFGFSKSLYNEHAELKNRLTSGNELIIDANIFEKMPEIFHENLFENSIAIYGRLDNKRTCKYIKREYIKDSYGVNKYKVFVTGANGTGEFGGVLSNPFVGGPYAVGTQTYMSFGFFETKEQADSLLVYLKTKFARCMLGVLKVTQNNPKDTWRYVPLQDFTENSDIDWSKSVAEIDRQLYKKYGLTQEEIDFIETHVKEMA